MGFIEEDVSEMRVLHSNANDAEYDEGTRYDEPMMNQGYLLEFICATILFRSVIPG